MKIVFAIDLAGQTAELGAMLKLAIRTCQANTSHRPLVISNNFSPAFQKWLGEHGVQTFTVQSPISDAVKAANARSGYPLQAIGNYLRYEACRVITDDVFLYCDCDTIFLRDFQSPAKPGLLAAVAEDTPEDWSRFNSGVMLFNRLEMLKQLDGFYQFASQNLESFFPGFDQAAINEYFARRIEHLPIELNWRPYWGYNARAAILHTHGVKPHVARSLLDGYFVADQNKKDLIIDIVCRTLTHSDNFFAPISQKFPELMDDTILCSWAALATKAAALVESPLAKYVEYAQVIRHNDLDLSNLAELSMLEVGLSRASVVQHSFACDSVTAVRFVLTAPTIYHVLTNLVEEGSGTEFPIESCTVGNLQEIKSITVGDRTYRLLKKTRADLPLDLIYYFSTPSRQTLRIGIVNTAKMYVKRYWATGGPFSEAQSETIPLK
jgi:hypothetical protein